MRKPSTASVDRLAERIAPVTAETLAERAQLVAWLRSFGGNAKAVEQAIADAVVDAASVLAPALTVADLQPWVDAAVASTVRPGERAPAAQWARTPSAARRWTVSAAPGQMLVYHVGELARDRQGLPILDATADYLAAIDEIGAVRTFVARTSMRSCSVYGAHRRAGLTQHPVVLGIVAPLEYRALLALTERDPKLSAARWIERRIPCDGVRAREIVASLLAGGLVRHESDTKGRPGLALTQRGMAAIEGRERADG